jgi:methionine-rich copper-binding protein CopC
MTFTTLAAALFTAALALGAAPINAHSTKEATHPADGAVLTAAPDRIAMTFDMPMRVTLITLTDQDGSGHALTRTDNMQPVTDFTAQPPALPAGQYTIEWRGLAGDGHAMQGAFGFEITN